MSNQILKDSGLSEVSNSSSSNVSKGGRADEPHPIAVVTATGVIDLDPEFGKPSIRIIDDAIERASVREASADKASTSGAVAPVIGGGFLPVGLNPESVLIDSDLLLISFQYGIPESVKLRLLKPNKCMDSADDYWTCFYELLFRQGLRFPIPYLIRRLLALLDMAPGQLMPNGWRLLLSLEAFTS
ncbi:hypothetical protein ACOSQ2_013722 [Xanthoceras sorbifolium]